MKPRYFKKTWTNEWVKISYNNNGCKMLVVIIDDIKKLIAVNTATFKMNEVIQTYAYCTKHEFEQKFNEAKEEIGL